MYIFRTFFFFIILRMINSQKDLTKIFISKTCLKIYALGTKFPTIYTKETFSNFSDCKKIILTFRIMQAMIDRLD